MPHFESASSGNGRHHVVRFALRLTALPRVSLAPPSTDRLRLQRMFLSRILDHAQLPLLVAPAVELRVIKRQHDIALPQLDIGLICRLQGDERAETERSARAYAAHVVQVVRELLGQHGYHFETADSRKDFIALAAPFALRDYGEVRREERYCPVHLDASHPDVDGFSLWPSMNEICRSLLFAEESALVGVVVAPAAREVHAYAGADDLEASDERGTAARARPAPAGALAVGVGAVRPQTCRGWLELLQSEGYLVRVHAASPRIVTPALVSAIGGEVMGPGRHSEDLDDVSQGRWQWLRPRAGPASRSEHEIAERNLELLRFEPWGCAEASSQLTLLADANEASALFALPVADETLAQVVPATSLRGGPADRSVAQEGAVLGVNRWGGFRRQVAIGTDDRRRHTWVIGQTGTGKSTLIESLVMQDIMSGAPVILVEPHGDLIEQVLGKIPYHRIDDVILIDPADRAHPVGMNLLEAPSTDDWPFLINAFIALLYRLYDPHHSGVMGPRFEHAARNAMMTVMSAGGTLVEVVRVLTDDSFVRQLLPSVKDPLVRSYWEHEIAKTTDFHRSEVVGYFVSKFARFVSDSTIRNIVGQSKSAFDFRQAIEQRRIVLVNLSKGRLGAENSAFLGMVMLPKILLAALSRVDVPEARRHDAYLYVDEFQNFASDALTSMLTEARKYRLNLTLANQHIGQIDGEICDALVGNAGNIISFRAGYGDAELLARAFRPSSIEASDIAGLPNFHAYARLLAAGRPTAPFLLESEPAAGSWCERDAALVRQVSRERYGRPRAEVEQDIAARAFAPRQP